LGILLKGRSPTFNSCRFSDAPQPGYVHRSLLDVLPPL
jgi:hypothetical protein